MLHFLKCLQYFYCSASLVDICVFQKFEVMKYSLEFFTDPLLLAVMFR